MIVVDRGGGIGCVYVECMFSKEKGEKSRHLCRWLEEREAALVRRSCTFREHDNDLLMGAAGEVLCTVVQGVGKRQGKFTHQNGSLLAVRNV